VVVKLPNLIPKKITSKMHHLSVLFILVLVSKLGFCQSPNDSIKIQYDNNGDAGLINSAGDTITPFVFISLSSIGSGLYIFDAYPEYRGRLKSIINSGAVPNKENLNFDLDADQYHVFRGVINCNGEIIGDESYRMVEHVLNTENPPLFMVQSQEEFEKTESGDFALMNQNGEILSEFYFENVSSNGDILTGNIVTEEYFRTVRMKKSGEIIEIVYEQTR